MIVEHSSKQTVFRSLQGIDATPSPHELTPAHVPLCSESQVGRSPKSTCQTEVSVRLALATLDCLGESGPGLYQVPRPIDRASGLRMHVILEQAASCQPVSRSVAASVCLQMRDGRWCYRHYCWPSKQHVVVSLPTLSEQRRKLATSRDVRFMPLTAGSPSTLLLTVELTLVSAVLRQV